jgi:hypothetical protein
MRPPPLDNEGDVVKRNVLWIASYPKSGNTWIHSVLRTAGRGFDFPQVDMDVYNIVGKQKELSICGAVDPSFAENPCVVLKTHSPYTPRMHSMPGVELVSAAYIHITRNPLDVLLSYINFTRLDYQRKPTDPDYRKTLFSDLLGFDRPFEVDQWLGMTLDQIPQRNLDHALQRFSDDGLALKELRQMAGSWVDNTESWKGAAGALPGYTVRYEDCVANPNEVAKLADLFTFGRKEVLNALAFENTKAKTQPVDPASHSAVFYNKMSAYYYVDYFSRPAIDAFLARHESVLCRLGYPELFDLD